MHTSVYLEWQPSRLFEMPNFGWTFIQIMFHQRRENDRQYISELVSMLKKYWNVIFFSFQKESCIRYLCLSPSSPITVKNFSPCPFGGTCHYPSFKKHFCYCSLLKCHSLEMSDILFIGDISEVSVTAAQWVSWGNIYYPHISADREFLP